MRTNIVIEDALMKEAGHNIVIQSADNYRKLRKSGITVRKTIDVIIATFCIVEDLTLLHDDRGFKPMTTVMALNACSLKADSAWHPALPG